MSAKVTNQLLLEHLEAIQSTLGSMANDVGDLESDMRGLKSHMAGFMQSEVAQDSAAQSRPRTSCCRRVMYAFMASSASLGLRRRIASATPRVISS